MASKFNKRDIYLKSAFRKIWRWSPERKRVIHEAKFVKNGKTVFRCRICGDGFVLRKVVVDHIKPVVDPAAGFVDWNTYYARMFCPVAGLQVLCKATCHKEKTKLENKIRKKSKDGQVAGR